MMSDQNLYATAKAWGVRDIKPKRMKEVGSMKGKKPAYWLKGYQDMGFAMLPPIRTREEARKAREAWQKAFGPSYIFKITKTMRERK